jgi:hypothetical protein
LNTLLLKIILIFQVLNNIHIVHIEHATMFDTFTSCIS